MSYTTYTYATRHESSFIADFMDTERENRLATAVFEKLFDTVLPEWLSYIGSGEFYAYVDDESVCGDYDLDSAIIGTWEIIDSCDIAEFAESHDGYLDEDDFLREHPNMMERAEELHDELLADCTAD